MIWRSWVERFRTVGAMSAVDGCGRCTNCATGDGNAILVGAGREPYERGEFRVGVDVDVGGKSELLPALRFRRSTSV